MKGILRQRTALILLVFALLAGLPAAPALADELPPLEVGVAKTDITGPVAGVIFMGMAEPTQVGEGLSMRQHARAFVFKQGDKKMAYVIADICMVFQGVHQAVADELADEGYTAENLMLQGSHTHAGPAGTSHYFMYNVTPKGFNRQNFDVQVQAFVSAIRQAEQNCRPVPLTINEDRLFQCGWNRSPRAYEANPAADLEHYGRVSELTDLDHEEGFTNVENLPWNRQENDGTVSTGYVDGRDWNNTDKRMTMLKVGDTDMVNWFAIHPTNLATLWRYVSGDNKGYAEALWERTNEGLVGAFAQRSCGDVSGSVKYGPPSPTGIHDWEHCRELGLRQYEKAAELYADANGTERALTPVIDYRQLYVDFARTSGPDNAWSTAEAMVGGPMSAGSSEDSISCAPFFHEGCTTADLEDKDASTAKERLTARFLPLTLGIIWHDSITDKDYHRAHEPKILMLANGKCTFPGRDQVTDKKVKVPMSPEVLPVQIFRIGELMMVGMPIEITTMAARRIENTVKLAFNGDSDGDGFADETGAINHVVVCQCCNAYVGYLTTREEYNQQFYEAASNHFGPHALMAFQQTIGQLASAMAAGAPVDKTDQPTPRNLNGDLVSELSWGGCALPDRDRETVGRRFGSIVNGPRFEIDPDGTRYLKLTIWGAFPNRNLMHDSSYFTVTTPDNPAYTWAPANDTYTDADPETRLQWKKNVLGQSKITLWFDMTHQPLEGAYTINYTSEARTLTDKHRLINKSYTFNIEDIGVEKPVIAVQ